MEAVDRGSKPALNLYCYPMKSSWLPESTRRWNKGALLEIITPSVVPVQLSTGYIARFGSALAFGYPREMTVYNIRHVLIAS